jgi:hypothetical protein
MPYIGKSPTGSGVRQRYHFTATGGETSLSGADDNSKTLKFTDGEYVDVYLNGILLVQGTDYGVGTANTISSLAALAASDIVEVVVYDIYNVAKINSEAVRARHYYTATGGETSIGTAQIAGLSFAANAEIDVSLNGISLVAGTDYNTTTANTVGGLSALTAGQVVEIVIYEKFQLADALSKAAGGTVSGAVTASGGLNVGTIKEATGTTTAMTIDSSGRVNLGVPVHGHFYQNAAAASLGSVATLVKLTLDSTYEQSGGFSLASNEVTVPLTGRYRWSVAIALDVSAARRAVSFVLYKNGSIDTQNQFTHFAFPYVSGTTHNMLTASNTINCTAGDDVSLYLREYDNNSMTVKVYHFAMDFIG